MQIYLQTLVIFLLLPTPAAVLTVWSDLVPALWSARPIHTHTHAPCLLPPEPVTAAQPHSRSRKSPVSHAVLSSSHATLPHAGQEGRGVPGAGEEPAGAACGRAEVLRRGQQLRL